jgi:hypothetical protein
VSGRSGLIAFDFVVKRLAVYFEDLRGPGFIVINLFEDVHDRVVLGLRRGIFQIGLFMNYAVVRLYDVMSFLLLLEIVWAKVVIIDDLCWQDAGIDQPEEVSRAARRITFLNSRRFPGQG